MGVRQPVVDRVESVLGRKLPPLTFIPELPYRIPGGLYLVRIPAFAIRAHPWRAETIAEPISFEGVERRAVPTLAQVGFLVRHYFENPPLPSLATGSAYAFALGLSSIDRRGNPLDAIRPLALGLAGAPEDAPGGLGTMRASWVSPDVVRGLFPPPPVKRR